MLMDYQKKKIKKIKAYVNSHISNQRNNYKIIIADNRIIGCILLEKKYDGMVLDEIYIEENYRNKGLGTKIIKDVILNNSIIYLWVYKENVKAISLYQKLGFNTVEKTGTRLFMENRKE